MFVTFSPLQLLSLSMGLGMICYFWGSWVERRYLKKEITSALDEALTNLTLIHTISEGIKDEVFHYLAVTKPAASPAGGSESINPEASAQTRATNRKVRAKTSNKPVGH